MMLTGASQSKRHRALGSLGHGSERAIAQKTGGYRLAADRLFASRH